MALSETEEFEFRARSEAEMSAAPPKKENEGIANDKPSSQEIGRLNREAEQSEHGPVQDVMSMVGAIPAGIGEAATGVANFAQHPIDAITGAVKGVGGALLHPVETAKKAGTAIRNMTPEQMGKGIGSTLLGGAAGKAAGVLGDVVGPAAKAAVSGTPKAVSPIVDVARKAGYVLKPSEAGGKIGKVAEGMTGSPKLSVEASIKNQRVTNRLAAEEIGLPSGSKVTRGALAEAKKPHNSVYAEMGNLGDIATDKEYKDAIAGIGRTPGTSFEKAVNPDLDKLRDAYDEMRFNAKDGVLKIRELRASATKNIKAPFDPAKNELGFAQKQVADAIESQMERHAISLGKTDLAKRFRGARTELAKIHSVESAVKGNTGEVSAPLLARQLDRGVPLSGKLKIIADVANEFGEVTREGTKLRNKVPVTVLDSLGGIAGAGAAGMGHPALGVTGLAAMAARPAVRKALLSNAYQKRLGTQAPKPYTPIGKSAPIAGAMIAPGTDDLGRAQ